MIPTELVYEKGGSVSRFAERDREVQPYEHIPPEHGEGG